MKLLSIDPGNEMSGYVWMNEDYTIINIGKVENKNILQFIEDNRHIKIKVCIEMVASYGMSVGQTVFDTCVWIGRFYQASYERSDYIPKLIFRKDVKMNLCGQTRAKDTNIKQALIDRFAYGVPNNGKGYKKDPGYFYGFKADIWQAYALGVTCLDNFNDWEKEV